jgi:hypothetical protein
MKRNCSGQGLGQLELVIPVLRRIPKLPVAQPLSGDVPRDQDGLVQRRPI